jgi:hypothetical protein
MKIDVLSIFWPSPVWSQYAVPFVSSKRATVRLRSGGVRAPWTALPDS